MQKKTQWPLLLVAAIMSIGSVIVLSISMASNFWVNFSLKRSLRAFIKLILLN